MITTIYGDMPEEVLEKRTGGHDNQNETCKWVEYWFEGVLVHRSVNTNLKKGLFGFGEAQKIG